MIASSNSRGVSGESSESCCSQNRYLLVHKGGHEVPGPRNKDTLIDSARIIGQMLAKVQRHHS